MVCIIIWAIGLVWVYKPTVNGFQAIFEYFQANENIKNSQNLDKYELAMQYLHQENPNRPLSAEMFEIVTNKEKPLPDWLEQRSTAYANLREGIQTDKLDRAKWNLWGLTAFPTYLVLFFLVPWLLLRLIFWIKTADNVKKI